MDSIFAANGPARHLKSNIAAVSRPFLISANEPPLFSSMNPTAAGAPGLARGAISAAQARPLTSRPIFPFSTIGLFSHAFFGRRNVYTGESVTVCANPISAGRNPIDGGRGPGTLPRRPFPPRRLVPRRFIPDEAADAGPISSTPPDSGFERWPPLRFFLLGWPLARPARAIPLSADRSPCPCRPSKNRKESDDHGKGHA